MKGHSVISSLIPSNVHGQIHKSYEEHYRKYILFYFPILYRYCAQFLVSEFYILIFRIDAHVESAVEYTTRATNDTKKALEYQTKARRKKIMMLICLIIAGTLGTYMAGKWLELF